jgi:hypothetical protein
MASASGYETTSYQVIYPLFWGNNGVMSQNIILYPSSSIVTPSSTPEPEAPLFPTMDPSTRAAQAQKSGNLDAMMLPVFGLFAVLGILAAMVGRMGR